MFRNTINEMGSIYGKLRTVSTPNSCLHEIFSVDTVGARLRAFAKQKFGSLKAFGQAVDLSPSQVSDYVSDRYTPGGDLLTRMRALGLSVDWLLTGEGEMLVTEKRKGRARHPMEVGNMGRVIGEKRFWVVEIDGEQTWVPMRDSDLDDGSDKATDEPEPEPERDKTKDGDE